MRRRLVAAALAVVALTGCSHSVAPLDAMQIAHAIKCPHPSRDPQVIGVKEEVTCANGIEIMTFRDARQQQQVVDVFSSMWPGSMLFGDRFVLTGTLPQLKAAKRVIGGDIQ